MASTVKVKFNAIQMRRGKIQESKLNQISDNTHMYVFS